MLKMVTIQELTTLLSTEFPQWDREGVRKQAEIYHRELDEKLDAPLREYLDTGKLPNFRFSHEENEVGVSLYMIRELRERRSDFASFLLMDEYIKKPGQNYLTIFRR